MAVTTLDAQSAPVVIDLQITDVDVPSHEHTVNRIYPRIAETGSTAGVLALLSARGSLT